MSCPLCAHPAAAPSWLHSIFYAGREFRYLECVACRSLFCDPMPDGETLARMYGPEYQQAFHSGTIQDDPKEPHRTLGWLKKLGTGTFLDYGCGAGGLLTGAVELGWRAI